MKLRFIICLVSTPLLLLAKAPLQEVNHDALERVVLIAKEAVIKDHPYLIPSDIVPITMRYQFAISERGEREQLSHDDPPTLDTYRFKFYLRPTITLKLKESEKDPGESYPSIIYYLVAHVDVDNHSLKTKTDYRISSPTWYGGKGGFTYFLDRHSDYDLNVLSDEEEAEIFTSLIMESIDPDTKTVVTSLSDESTHLIVEELANRGYSVQTNNRKDYPRVMISTAVKINENTVMAYMRKSSGTSYVTMTKVDGKWLITKYDLRLIIN